MGMIGAAGLGLGLHWESRFPELGFPPFKSRFNIERAKTSFPRQRVLGNYEEALKTCGRSTMDYIGSFGIS